MLAFVRFLPPDSASVLSQMSRTERENREWTTTTQLLAGLHDLVTTLVWMQTEDGHRNRNRPYPIPRPGMEDDRVQHIGSDPVPLDEMRDFLGWDI